MASRAWGRGEKLPGLELLWQQETGMSGPHPQGSSWWAGGKVQRKPRWPGAADLSITLGKGQNRPKSTIGTNTPKGQDQSPAVRSISWYAGRGLFSSRGELTSLSGAEAEGRTGPRGALWRKGRGHSEACIIPGRHRVPLPSSNQQPLGGAKTIFRSQEEESYPLPAQPEPSPGPGSDGRAGLS